MSWSLWRRLRRVLATFIADEQGARKRDIKQFDDAAAEVERQIGRKLLQDERNQLHDEITGEGLDFQGIVQEGVALFGGSRDGEA